MSLKQSSIDAATALMKLQPIYQGSYSRKIEKITAPYTPLQIQCLFLLRDVGDMPMYQIAQHLRVSKQHLTRLVDALEQNELVQRRQNTEDRRTVIVGINDAGMQVLNNYINGAIMLYAELLEKLDDSDKASIVSSSQTLLKMFAKIEY